MCVHACVTYWASVDDEHLLLMTGGGPFVALIHIIYHAAASEVRTGTGRCCGEEKREGVSDRERKTVRWAGAYPRARATTMLLLLVR